MGWSPSTNVYPSRYFISLFLSSVPCCESQLRYRDWWWDHILEEAISLSSIIQTFLWSSVEKKPNTSPIFWWTEDLKGYFPRLSHPSFSFFFCFQRQLSMKEPGVDAVPWYQSVKVIIEKPEEIFCTFIFSVHIE